MQAILIIIGAFAYLVIGGSVYRNIQAHYRPLCRRAKISQCDSDCGHSVLAGLSVFLWPITLPVMLGVNFKTPQSRNERRRAKELAEAEHKVELARIRAEETAQLERALR